MRKRKVEKDDKKEEKKEKKVSLVKKVKKSFKKKRNKEPSSYGLLEVIIVAFIFTLFGIVIGYLLNYGRDTYTGKKIPKSVEEFIDAYESIHENYYGKLDENKLIEAAINGMVNSLDDPYSGYMNEEDASEFDEETTGSYVGIGVTVEYSDSINKIIEVNKEAPAYKAGMKEGDIIIEVDGTDVTNLFGDDLSSLIRGEAGSPVDVKVKRGDKVILFKITREKIDLISVSGYTIANNGKKVGVITISSFSSNTSKQFNKVIKQFEKEEVDCLVIDVRNNLGGQLAQVRNILDVFFDKNTVLFQVKSKNDTVKIKASDNKKKNYPVAVVINNGSASASEVLAACFKDNYKKVFIVGEQSFGKGTVQKTVSLKGGGKYKYTVEQWLTPKGKWIEGDGITPTHKVSNTEEYYNNPSYDNDDQLKKAIELVSK